MLAHTIHSHLQAIGTAEHALNNVTGHWISSVPLPNLTDVQKALFKKFNIKLCDYVRGQDEDDSNIDLTSDANNATITFPFTNGQYTNFCNYYLSDIGTVITREWMRDFVGNVDGTKNIAIWGNQRSVEHIIIYLTWSAGMYKINSIFPNFSYP